MRKAVLARHRLWGDFLGAFDSAEPAGRGDTIDEYRELAMLAHAWERRSLEPEAVEGAPGRVADAEVR